MTYSQNNMVSQVLILWMLEGMQNNWVLAVVHMQGIVYCSYL